MKPALLRGALAATGCFAVAALGAAAPALAVPTGSTPTTTTSTGTTPTGTTPTSTTPTGTTPTTTTPTTTTPTTSTPTTTTPTPTPTPKPRKHRKRHRHHKRKRVQPPAIAAPSLYVSGAFGVDGQQVTVPGRAVAVSAVVRPYVPGEQVLVQESLGGHLFHQQKLALARSPGGTYGGFTTTVSSPGVGQVQVVVVHSASKHLTAFKVSQSWLALDEAVGPGSTGPMVQLIQQRLAALHFYIPQTGVYDLGTELAVDAYHRLLRDGVSPLVGPATIADLLNGAGAFNVRFPNQGRHAEGDLSDQLLALIDGDQVQAIFPISSGKPSTPTVLGSYQVYSRVPGYLPDGMYFSDFFTGGYAIHGYDPAPDYPASHGCMRLPIVDAIPAYDWLAIGDWVDTYYT